MITHVPDDTFQLIPQTTALFAKRCRPVQYSGFGFPKKLEIAEAAKNGTLHCLMQDGSVRVVCAALGKHLTRPTTHHDFRGEDITIPAGDWWLSDFVVDEDFRFSDVHMFLQRFYHPMDGGLDMLFDEKQDIWCEVYLEDTHMANMMMNVRFHPAAFKVMAGSELKAIFCSNMEKALHYRDNIDPADIPTLLTLKQGFFVPQCFEICRQELKDYLKLQQEAWENHYSIYNDNDSWSAFALKGYKADDPSYIVKPTEMAKKWKASHQEDLEKYTKPELTTAAKHFPETLRLLKLLIPAEFDRIRFMRLAGKGGTLGRHTDITDREAGTSDGKMVRLHVPFFTNESVIVRGWSLQGKKDEQQWGAGNLYYLDQRKPHEVENNDPNAERIHLVFDVVSNEAIRQMLRNAK